MRFSKIIGVSNNPDIKKVIREAEEKLTAVFTELSLNFPQKGFGGIGGDPLIFQLLYPFPHVCDITAQQYDELKERHKEIEEKIGKGELPESEKIDEEEKAFRVKMGRRILRTAACDGSRFYWNPFFVNKQSKLGLRVVACHEALHALYLHPNRRGSRLPRLWNISLDYKVNFLIMEDFKARQLQDPPKIFEDNLGAYIRLEEYASFLRDPFNPPARLAHFNPVHNLREMADPAYKHPGEDKPAMYYADHELAPEMKRPENIYEYLFNCIPKCPECGKLGKYKKSEEYKQLEKKLNEEEKKKAKEKEKEGQQKGSHSHTAEEQEDNGHDHSQQKTDQNGSCCDSGCSTCGENGDYVDVDLIGDSIDDHIDGDVSEDVLNKRISDAIEASKRMGGKIPGGLEDELGLLSSPIIRWEDVVRQLMLRKREAEGSKDWTRPRNRPLFAGLYVPKQQTYDLKILAAYDCSGSMSKEDIAYGISQLQVIDNKGEMFLVGWDCSTYWKSMVKINKADRENLVKAKVVGRGGTECSSVFNEYEENCGNLDLLIVITDGFLADTELTQAKRPPKGTEVLFLITSHNANFKPPFGRVMHLRNEKL